MSNTALVSQLPNGVVPTISALRALSVATCFDGIQVAVNGTNVQNDGGQGIFTFAGAGAGVDDGRTIVSTPTTGSWVRTFPVYSGQAVVPVATYSGLAETFVVLSGNSVVYTFAPTAVTNSNRITLKFIGTGNLRIQATGNDLLWDTNAASFATSISGTPQTGGAFNFQSVYNPTSTSGIYYRV